MNQAQNSGGVLNSLQITDGLDFENPPFYVKAGEWAVRPGLDEDGEQYDSLWFKAGEDDDVGDADAAGWSDPDTDIDVQIKIRYFDKGTDKIQVGYTDDASTETVADIVTKTNTKEWLNKKIVLNTVRFGTYVYAEDADEVVGAGGDHDGADFRITTDGDPTQLILSRVRVKNRTTKAIARFSPLGDDSDLSQEIDDGAFRAVTITQDWTDPDDAWADLVASTELVAPPSGYVYVTLLVPGGDYAVVKRAAGATTYDSRNGASPTWSSAPSSGTAHIVGVAWDDV